MNMLWDTLMSLSTPSLGSFRLAVLAGICRSGVTGRMAGRVFATHPSLRVRVMRTPAGTGLYTGAWKASTVEVEGRLFIIIVVAVWFALTGGRGRLALPSFSEFYALAACHGDAIEGGTVGVRGNTTN